MTTKILKCRVCGNVIVKVVDSNITPSCCNRNMIELVPNTTEAKEEFHMPSVSRIDCSTIKVVIGKEPHPMTPEHHINFILLETKSGIQIRHLTPNCEPEAIFFTTETPVAVYSYCNLHGLWKIDMPCKKDSSNA